MSAKAAAWLVTAGVLTALLLLWQSAVVSRERARRAQAAAEVALDAAVAERALAANAAKVVEKVLAREISLTKDAKEDADVITNSPGADAPLPAGVLVRWSDAVERLRREAAADRGARAPEPARRPEGALSPAG